MAGHEWEDWFEREEFIGQISDMRVQNLQVEREVVQKRTFTRWINLHLEKCDPPIEVCDLFRDIQDGHILMALLEELSGCKLLHGFKKSSHRIFRLNNIAKVLSFLEERNVKLVSIDAADVADGNSSIILGLIWNIILFFQIKELTGNIRSQFPSSSSLSSIPTSSESDTSLCSLRSDERQTASMAMREHSKTIKKLLQWVQKRTRKFGVAVQDFGKSWTSGLAFLAVIKSIDPSLVDMRKALLRTARENLEEAFRIAHYSLGIPRLLEPEDVTINAPDEQSIMTYVAQFLEHFPGQEEPEEPCQLIERSISLCHLNFHDSDSNRLRNCALGSRVKERSYMFQKDCAHPPPKILISSVSEERGTVSRAFRSAAARSWSSEDFLVDSSHMDDIYSSVVEEPKETASEDLITSTSDSPQLPFTHSPTGSSAIESVIGDSAISSPDSWVESEFGVMPGKFCESRSDSSLCDSGTAWDVYRATPVEIITSDEGFVLRTEDRVPDEPTPESYIDEGIYSLSSLESTQDGTQGHPGIKHAEVVMEKEDNLGNHNQNLEVEQVPDHSGAEITKEVDSKEMDTTLLQKGQVPRQQEPSFVLCDAEALVNSTSVEAIPCGESQNWRITSEEVEEETECQKADTPLECTVGKSRDKEDEGVIQTQDKTSKGVSKDCLDPEESICSVTSDALTNTHSTNQDRASKTTLDLSTYINIPLISISTEPEEQDEEGTCDPDRQDRATDDEVHQTEVTVSKESDTDVNSPQNPDELSCDSGKNDKKQFEISSCQVSENVKLTSSEQIESDRLDEADKPAISRSSNTDMCSPDEQECETPQHNSRTDDSDKGLIVQTSSADAEFQPVTTEKGTYLTSDQLKGDQDKLGDSANKLGDGANKQQNAMNPVDWKHKGTAGTSCCEADSVCRKIDLFYTDQNSPTDDLVGEPIEPMDLFYPDREEPVFSELPDTEMQRWPSVLSVSALQPAPASETLPNERLVNLLGEDFRSRVDSMQENDKAIMKSNQGTDKASEAQKQCLLPVEKIEALFDDAGLADGSDVIEAEQQGSESARENTESLRIDTKSSSRQDEIQIPPVLRHRKGLRFTQHYMENQTAVTGKVDAGDLDVWWSENSELYLLLLLWLLLYCFWLLPQMDLKSLPGLLLNLCTH